MATAAITAYAPSAQQHKNNGIEDSSGRQQLRKMNTAKMSIYASLSKSTDQTVHKENKVSEPNNHRKSQRFQDSSRARIPRNTKCIIDPKSTFQSRWDVIMMVLLLFVAIVTPYEVGFLEIEDMLHPLWIINRVVDLLFLQDLFQQFMTPFYNEEHGGWVIEHGKIAKHYLTGWFPIDFVSIIPFSLIGSLFNSKELDQLKILRIIRLARLAKLLRIFKSSRIIKRYQSHVGISHATQTMIKFAIGIFAVAHWLACAWGIVTTIDTTERYGQKVNWIQDYALWDQIQGKPYRIYLSSLYWAAMTVTTIGYGDIRPTNEAEQILCIFGMVLGASAYAYVIGNVCGVIALMDQATSKYNQQMDELNLYMAENNMPNTLRIRLREYFQYSKQLNRQRYYQALLMEMSPSLRGEVANFINSAWLENIPFFNPPSMLINERETFCTDISLRLKPEAYAPQEVVVREGEPTEKFYLLQRGVMASRGRIIGTGSYIGEDFVLHKSRRNYSVRAITYIDVFSLSKMDLEEVLSTNNLPSIGPRVRLFAIQTAFTLALTEYSKGVFKPHRSSHTRTPRATRAMINQSNKKNAVHGQNRNNNASPEQVDVVGDAEREIALSRSVQSPERKRVQSTQNSPGGRSIQNQYSSSSLSGSSHSFNSPSGKVRRISTGAAGSASKVLQLMAERHDHSMESNQKCMEVITRANTDSKKRLDTLTKKMEEQQAVFQLYGKIGGVLFAAVLMLSLVVLLKNLGVF